MVFRKTKSVVEAPAGFTMQPAVPQTPPVRSPSMVVGVMLVPRKTMASGLVATGLVVARAK